MYRIEYALYRGEKLVDMGTANQLADKYGVKRNTIRFMATPAHFRRLAAKKKPTGRAKYTIRIEDENE